MAKFTLVSERLVNLKQEISISMFLAKDFKSVSLSGLSGILAGIYALIGGFIANKLILGYGKGMGDANVMPISILEIVLIVIAIGIAFLSIITAYLLTKRKAKKNNEKIWTPVSKQMLISFIIPILVGGIFSLLLINRGYYGLIAPITLIFYGLALINASKYTMSMINYLGLLELVLGLLAMIFFGNGILFWMLGFGVLHIIYGALIFFKQDAKK